MIKRNKPTLILTSCVILLPIVAGLILWSKLPARIPIHWNAAGEIDGYSNKAFAVFGMPLIMLALQWLGVLVTGMDPKHNQHNEKFFFLVLWIIPLISIILMCVMYSTAFGVDLQIARFVPLLLGLMFVFIGNYMPKFSQNYTIGIKLPWTLDSKENWNKTHRLAGKLWVLGGIVTMLLSFIGLVYVLIVIFALMVLVPTVYSYLLYRKSKAN